MLPTDIIIPRDATLLEIRDSYGPLSEEVRCGLEGCRTPHKRGFIVSFGDTSGVASGVGIVGHVCGQNAFGTNWLEAEQAYDAKVRAAEMDAARERFLVRSGRILPELRAALPRLKLHYIARRVLEKNAAFVMKTCVEAVKSSHGRIGIYRGGQHRILHRLEGESFWTTGNNALPRATELDVEATSFQEYLRSPNVTKKEAERRLGNLTDIEHRWGLVSKAMQAAESALQPSHLGKVFEAVDQVIRSTPHWHPPGLEPGDEWQLNVRLRGTVLEIRARDVQSGSTRETWIPAVDLVLQPLGASRVSEGPDFQPDLESLSKPPVQGPEGNESAGDAGERPMDVDRSPESSSGFG